jgi:hypothetical protein
MKLILTIIMLFGLTGCIGPMPVDSYSIGYTPTYRNYGYSTYGYQVPLYPRYGYGMGYGGHGSWGHHGGWRHH